MSHNSFLCMQEHPYQSQASESEVSEHVVQAPLPSHVERYRALLLRHNDLARKRKRSEAEEQEKEELKQKLVRSVGDSSIEQQKDIEAFVRQITNTKVIADEASKTHEYVMRTMHWLPRTMKLAADVIPSLCRETARLALSTVGLTLVGLGHGIKTTAKAVHDLFFGQAA